MLVGASGKKRHGKDSVGQSLARSHGFHTIAFADPIKQTVMDWYGFTYDQVYGDLKEEVDSRWGITPRHAMQILGTEVGRLVHQDTWIRKCLTTITEAQQGLPVMLIDHEQRRFRVHQWPAGQASRWVICDVRFPNESEMIQANGGHVVKVFRPGIGASGDLHVSETNVDLVRENFLLVNDSTLEDLAAKVSALPFLQPDVADWCGTTVDPADMEDFEDHIPTFVGTP